ncbi:MULTISPECIES: acetoacetate--CoA ligase [Gordonia]|uniref:acetoacetate--CoA ligase n=1 Tax=Gordonia TaxID=2053 RepID=UPI00128F7387|nr:MULTISPECIES: acetoacetate--CoA ligase [Gordonia]
MTTELDILWAPTAHSIDQTEIGRFMAWLRENRGLEFSSAQGLWQWSVDDLDGFWSAIWEFFSIRSHTPYSSVRTTETMPNVEWFPGATLNYAEHMVGADADLDSVAVLGRSQTRSNIDLTFGELRAQVAMARAVLRKLGVKKGDCVVGYLPNIPETLVAFLATASLGATWATCATEFGARSVIDRFGQIEPVVLLVAGGYRFGEKDIDLTESVATIRSGLHSVRTVIDIEYGPYRVDDSLSWTGLLAEESDATLEFEPVPFGHPLVVLFSSGTTGKPKAIVHGHGGLLLEHLKNDALSWDLHPGDRMLWFTTTAWMMWNALVSALLTRSSIVMIDGNPAHPGLRWQWELAEETGATMMGAAPGFVMGCRAAGIELAGLELSVRTVGCAGSPLPPEGFDWIYEQLGPDVVLNVGSGGTDVCTGIVQSNPLLPVIRGRISGRALGVAAYAFDDAGEPVLDRDGELVITEPMPSMPVRLWADDDGDKLRSTYFDRWPGMWRHGDWISFAGDGSCVVTGRSDATLNRGGVRLGTAEFYRVVEEMPEVRDSLVVHLEDPEGGNGRLLLFVVPAVRATLDDAVKQRISRELRTSLSPRHIPDEIHEIDVVPRNRTGKKLEVPAKRILAGTALSEVAAPDALADPTSLDPFVELSKELTR